MTDKDREDMSASHQVLRVARGGSWLDLRDFARASFRSYFVIVRFNLIGFRLMCVRPLIL